MNIAIVEDLDKDRMWLKDLLHSMLEANDHLNIYEFSDDKTFFQSFSPGRFDIIFLDIYLDNSTGIDIAKGIRQTDKYVSIIFTTQSVSHAVDIYSVRATYYLLKPIEKEKLHEALNICICEGIRESKYIEFTSKRKTRRIRMSNIVYAANSRNVVMLHTVDGCEKIYKSFADFAPELLDDSRFLQSYYDCIVNMDYIAHVDKTRFILFNGEIIQIQKRNAVSIKSLYHQYAFSKTMGNRVNIISD